MRQTSGFPFWGSDISGYACLIDPPPDKALYLRWVEFGALSLSQKAGVQTKTDAVKWADVVAYETTETELAILRRLGPPLILPLRRVSMVTVCAALIAEGIGSVRKTP